MWHSNYLHTWSLHYLLIVGPWVQA
jgi:hypothetical protein